MSHDHAVKVNGFYPMLGTYLGSKYDSDFYFGY